MIRKKHSFTTVNMKNFQVEENNDVQSETGSKIFLVHESKKTKNLGPYDPSKHRKLEHPTSDLETLIHLIKGSMGSGILAMPMAFSHAGTIMGFVCTILIGIITTYSIHILVKSAHLIYRRNRIPTIGYADLAEASFTSGPERFRPWARAAKFMIDFFLVIYLIGCCSVYVGLVSKNFKQVIDFRTQTDYDVRIYMAITLLPLIPINLIKSLKYLSPCSMVANVLMVVSLGITFYYVCQDIPSLNERPSIVEVQQLPMFFGTVIFALEGIGVMMPLENNMEKPSHFIGCPGVLSIGMTFVVSLYTLTGFLGYLKYGDETDSVITLNLNEAETLAQSVKIMMALVICVSYVLQFYVLMEIIWTHTKSMFTKNPVIAEISVRITVVIATVLLAIAVPNLSGFISLVGAVSLSMLGLIFPALIEIATVYEDPGFGKFSWRLHKNMFLILFGLVGFLSGSYVSLQEIIESY